LDNTQRLLKVSHPAFIQDSFNALTVIRIFLQLAFLNIVLVVSSCTHDSLFTSLESPSRLEYLPDSLSVEVGSVDSSVQPGISGAGPFTFNISTVPSSGGNIIIDEGGIIRTNDQLVAGTYKVSVVVINSAGSVNFPDVYTVRAYDPVTPPSQLVYTPSTVSVLTGTSFTSSSPSISGTGPFTFSLVNNPAAGKISINNQGVVTTTTTLPSGSYPLDIAVTNSIASQTFNTALTIEVTNTATPPSSLSYSANSMTINSGSAGTSVTPSISGTSPFTFSLTSSPNAGASVTIDNNGVISANSSVAPGSYTLSVKVTNGAGTADFPAAYSIHVNEVKAVTFANDVKPLMSLYCSTCHTTGPQTIYTNYSNASRDINVILDRVQRTQGAGGFMPKNGSPLTTAQVQILKDWLAQGLPQ
jgi:hypothetical protein